MSLSRCSSVQYSARQLRAAVWAGCGKGARVVAAGARTVTFGVVLLLIRLWQLVPQHYIVPDMWPTRCRFYPTCSRYALEACRVHGVPKGVWLGARRLVKCHPWHPGGIDEVPPRRSARTQVLCKQVGGDRAWRSGTA